MNTTYLIVWALFGIVCVFILYFYSKRMIQLSKDKKIQQGILLEKQAKYEYLKPGSLDEVDEDHIDEPVLFKLMRVENEYDDYYEHMNHSEHVIHGIYSLNQSLTGKNASIQSFFESPGTECYVNDIQDYFEEIGAHQLHDLVAAVKRLIEIIDNDEDDDEDDPIMGIYSRYNFTDFSQEYVSLLATTNVHSKICKYILDHKEDFYDDDITESNEEMEDEDEC